MKTFLSTLTIIFAVQSLLVADDFSYNRDQRFNSGRNQGRPVRLVNNDHNNDYGYNPGGRRPVQPKIGRPAMGSQNLGMAYELMPGGQILVTSVFPNGGADVAGLKRNDVIFYIDGLDARQVDLENTRITRPVLMTVQNARTQTWRSVSFLPGNRLGMPMVGNPLARLTKLDIGVEALPMGTLRVSGVNRNGLAAELGLRNGDIILEINRQKATATSLSRQTEQSFTLKVRRGRQTMTFSRMAPRPFNPYQPEPFNPTPKPFYPGYRPY